MFEINITLLILVVDLEQMLTDMDLEIKNSLQAGCSDHDKCLAVMNELETLQVSGIMLRKNPEIVATIKRVGHCIKVTIFFFTFSCSH